MITVTLTNPRHIAGATAAYLATVPPNPEDTPPYSSVQEYVQARIEAVATSWADSTNVDKISIADFVFRFTSSEIAAITGAAASNPTVASILATLRARGSVRLGSAEATQGVGYLVSIGLITAERGAEILHYSAQ